VLITYNHPPQYFLSPLATYNWYPSSLLSQYSFCAGGVGLGAAYGIKYSKGVVPMAVSGVVGTMADMAYGYIVACSKEVEIYNKSSGGEK